MIKVDYGDIKLQAKTIKQEVSKLLTKLWENRSLGLQRLVPGMIFCVPMQLLEIDFQNIELGEFSILGLELPVSVSCLDRYENAALNKYRDSWILRWRVLEDFREESCYSHLEEYREEEVDISCPRALHRWLLRKDGSRNVGRKVTGIGFYTPYKQLAKVFRNFLVNGLPIIFWPKHSLNAADIDRLRTLLKVFPSQPLSTFMDFRIASNHDDAGPVSVLLDNPYLPPPDSEVDY